LGGASWQRDEPEAAQDAVENIFCAAASFGRRQTSFGSDRNGFATAKRQNEESAMKRTLIRYRTTPEMAGKNAELVAAVFAELAVARPEGTRYLSLRLEDDTFIHFVETAAEDGASALPKLAAFQAFQSGIRERCVEPPLVRGVTIVGNYRMLGEP
jgi:hypothetical protein